MPQVLTHSPGPCIPGLVQTCNPHTHQGGPELKIVFNSIVSLGEPGLHGSLSETNEQRSEIFHVCLCIGTYMYVCTQVCVHMLACGCLCVCTMSLAVFAPGLDLGSSDFSSGNPVQFAFLFCSEILLIKPYGGSGADKLGAVSN